MWVVKSKQHLITCVLWLSWEKAKVTCCRKVVSEYCHHLDTGAGAETLTAWFSCPVHWTLAGSLGWDSCSEQRTDKLLLFSDCVVVMLLCCCCLIYTWDQAKFTNCNKNLVPSSKVSDNLNLMVIEWSKLCMRLQMEVFSSVCPYCFLQ